jgi:hypothetical protein
LEVDFQGVLYEMLLKGTGGKQVEFQKSIIETMQKRHSIRTYDTQRITDHDLNKLTEYIEDEHNLIGLFGNKSRIELVLVTNNVSDKGIKLGTYGFIKNPSGYLVGVAQNNLYALLDLAYCFHKLVLFLDELEMGTCWVEPSIEIHSKRKSN